MKKIEVVAAILINENKILCVQRAESKLPYISKKFESYYSPLYILIIFER